MVNTRSNTNLQNYNNESQFLFDMNSVNIQKENEISRLKIEVENLKNENIKLNEKLNQMYNVDQFYRLKESIAICLGKAFADIEAN